MRNVAFYLLYKSDMEELEPEIAERCLRYLHGAIEAGDLDAMMDLGGMYITGRGVPKSREKALYWYGRAAEMKHPTAFNRIAQVYLYDEDTEGLGYLPSTDDPERLQKAFAYFKQGAKLGEAGCMIELGIMCMKGECVEADMEKGFRWFRRAYDVKNADPADRAEAAYSLAVCYHNGEGVKKDLDLALEYAEEARDINLREYKEGRTGSHYFVERSEEELQRIIATIEGE